MPDSPRTPFGAAHKSIHPDVTKRPQGRLLVAEDDEMLQRFLRRLLEAEGYEVEAVQDGPSALRHAHAAHDLLLLDLNLPEIDGFGVLQQLRPRLPKLPILVLTARGRSDGVLAAMDHGADDGLAKPFSYIELLTRIRALLRRTSHRAQGVSRCGDLVLDREQMLATRAGKRIELTQREFALLECLMRTPGVPVPRAVLLREVWGESCEPSTNVVDVYMKYLRDKVDLPDAPKLIRTIRGTGYAVSES